MRTAWLETGMHPAVAGVLAVFVGYMTVVLPLYRWWRWPRMSGPERHRLGRMLRLRYVAHLALGGALLLVPGVGAINLGLTVTHGRGWPAAVGIVIGATAVAVVLALRQRLAAEDSGESLAGGREASRRYLRDTTLGGLGDTVVYFALPPLVAIGAFGLPPGPVAVAMAVGYGFVHLPQGLPQVLAWTAVAAVAVTVSFMTASVLLAAVLITAVALTRIYTVPAD